MKAAKDAKEQKEEADHPVTKEEIPTAELEEEKEEPEPAEGYGQYNIPEDVGSD